MHCGGCEDAVNEALTVPGHAKDFPIINKKVYNAVCAFAVILLQVCLTGTDIYTID